MDIRSFLVVVAMGTAYLLWGRDIGRWGFKDAFLKPKPSSWLAILLMLGAMSQSKKVPPETQPLMGIIFLILPVAIVLFRMRQFGTWNIIGIDMRKICYIRDLSTERFLRGGSLELMAELGNMLIEEDDWRVRRCILNALAARPSVMALAHLYTGAADNHPSVQIEALKGIGYSAMILVRMRQLNNSEISELISRLNQLKGKSNLNAKVTHQMERTLKLLSSIR